MKEKDKGKSSATMMDWGTVESRRSVTLYCSRCRTVESSLNEWKGEGEEEEQWLAVETTKADGELRELRSTVLYFYSSYSDNG